MRETKKTCCLVLIFCGALCGIVLTSVSLATEHWVESKPTRAVNKTEELLTEDSQGSVNLGLFRGQKQVKVLNYNPKPVWVVCIPDQGVCGLSGYENPDMRTKEVEDYIKNLTKSTDQVFQKIQDDGILMSFNLWISVLVFAGLGIVWGLITIIFSCINLATTPIETITGPMGLYLWNAFACLFTFITVILFVVLFLTDLKNNVLEAKEIGIGWSSKDRTEVGYSFWLIVAATLCYLLNILFVIISGTQCKVFRKSKSHVNQNASDGMMMY
ncbi:clarin-3 isoform X2 [Lingula anatina]|uniref:Clarin-3 isoform X2 n=1 Tax=Lingula anatina TaxID=7574 RepID=A0A1S3GXW0_LINAN|nr:clarin-3 isoform X2 [Lingula anatina]|eukprot:XP_013378705.1 clarin-3 isoform X2 [Lingula anatina]